MQMLRVGLKTRIARMAVTKLVKPVGREATRATQPSDQCEEICSIAH